LIEEGKIVCKLFIIFDIWGEESRKNFGKEVESRFIYLLDSGICEERRTHLFNEVKLEVCSVGSSNDLIGGYWDESFFF
jgi:hypothetical protein